MHVINGINHCHTNEMQYYIALWVESFVEKAIFVANNILTSAIITDNVI